MTRAPSEGHAGAPADDWGARAGVRTKCPIVPVAILALSLAVVLLAAAASSASSERGLTAAITGNIVTATTPPLTLYVSGRKQKLEKKLKLPATTSNDSMLVVRGDVKKTTKRLKAFEETKVKARLRHLKRLKEGSGKPKVKVKSEATDEFGQAATDEAKVTLCSRMIPIPNKSYPRCAPFPSSR